MLAYGAALAPPLGSDELDFSGRRDGRRQNDARARNPARAWLQRHVKSPTYTLVEPYEFAAIRVYHFDFYRIRDPEELEYIGLDDLLGERAIKLIEWPEKRARPASATATGHPDQRARRRTCH